MCWNFLFCCVNEPEVKAINKEMQVLCDAPDLGKKITAKGEKALTAIRVIEKKDDIAGD